MTKLTLQKRLAAEVLGVGESRIWIDPTRIDEVADAITREDIKRLIKDGVIRVKPPHVNSRGRWRVRHEQKKKGRRRGHGSRKGEKGARAGKKEQWVNKIRAIRRYLKMLKEKRLISTKTFRMLYRLAKGGYFRSVAHVKAYIEEHNLLEKRPIR